MPLAREIHVVVGCVLLLAGVLALLAADALPWLAPVTAQDTGDDDADPGEEDDEDDATDADADAGGWNLEVLEEHYHPLARAIEAREYEAASKLAKQLSRTARKEGWNKAEKRRLKFLTQLARELHGARKLVDRKRNSHKDLQALTLLTRKNRETFAYLHFQELENELRGSVGITPLFDVEPPLSMIRLVEPFDFFSPVQWQVPSNPSFGGFITGDLDKVFQGRFAIEYRDSQEKRNLALTLPVTLEDSWAEYRYLYITAKIVSPNDGSLEIHAYKPNGYYFILKLASWKGWKTHRIDFHKIGMRHRTYLRFEWGRVDRLTFALKGNVSDFYLDDIHLAR